MSLDLYQRETAERVSSMPLVREPEAGAWDGFARGAGLYTMQGLAYTARGIDLLGSVGPIAQDAFTGGTTAQEKYFREHDEVWGSAVDHWTPKPNEVGVAAQVTGELLSMLPQVIASPALAVTSMTMRTGEDLVKKGVDWKPALATGLTQGAGLGLGIWMPIIGQNLWQRMVVGGAGFNLLQGVTTRAASGMILEGTPAAEDFKAFDGTALTLDVLLGLGFGGMVHLSPAARAQGAEVWGRIQSWAEALSPTQKAAIGTLRLAQHMNVDSAPGVPAGAADVEAHVARVRTAIEQLERGQPVEVANLPEPRFEADHSRVAEMGRRADELVQQAERVRKAEGLPEIQEPAARVEAPREPATESEAPAAKPGGTEPPPPRGPRGADAAGAEGTNPLRLEAERIANEQPDLAIRTGEDADGTPVTKSARAYLDDVRKQAAAAREDVKLFEIAAQCLFGGT